MPQGTDLEFLIMGACLLMQVASASNKVEHKGSTVYDTPNILVQLGERGVRDLPGMHKLPIQPVNSSDTKAHDSLPLVWQQTCSLGSQPRWSNIHKLGH